ncbi:ankyrin repeat-containing domain protein [Tirmania nivea]|nr:ankyrin repeat-containing domain protein [Tirmania nivea]
MGDPLSITTSIAGLITISAKIVGMARDLFGKVKDVPETMMRVRAEVESMQPIFCQVHLLLHGSGPPLNHSNLTMISIQNLMATLTGCVIVYSKLEKKVNEVCGFDDPTAASATWKSAGVIADRVKWALWRHQEALCIIEDLQRQKLSLNLMLNIITCTKTTEASELQARLQAVSTEILQLGHAHSVLLQDLISLQEAVLRRQDEQAQVLEEIRSNISALRTTGSSAVSIRPSSADSRLPDSSDDASTMSKRSTFSHPVIASYMEEIKASRAYKRSIDSSAEWVLLFDRNFSFGNWEMLSNITLGDLPVSEIAVLNLPIDLADVSNPEPFLEPSSVESQYSRLIRRGIWSSRGCIHNAIENGNELAVRTLLAMGMNIEELNSLGRTPLVHAAVKRQEAICKKLLEKGVSVKGLKMFTSGMTFTERFELLVPSTVSMHNGLNTIYKTTLQLLSLIESRNSKGWTPLASAAFNNNEALCEFLVERGCSLYLDTEQKERLKPKLSGSLHVATKGGHKTALQLLLDMGADVNERSSYGETVLLKAVYYGHLPCVKILIKMRADTKISSNGGSNVLHLSASRSTDCEMMKFLLEHVVGIQALVNAQDQEGNTPLHLCSLNNHIVCLEYAKMLVEAGATLTIKNNDGRTPYEYARFGAKKQLAEYLWSQLSLQHDSGEGKSTPD